MCYFRVVFVKNEVISCTEAIDTPQSLPHYEQDGGELIFALVKAQSEAEARQVAHTIINDVRKFLSPGKGNKAQ